MSFKFLKELKADHKIDHKMAVRCRVPRYYVITWHFLAKKQYDPFDTVQTGPVEIYLECALLGKNR